MTTPLVAKSERSAARLPDPAEPGFAIPAPGTADPQRLAELTALTEAGLAIVRARLDVQELCELAFDQVSRIVDARNFHLGLFEGDAFVLRVWVRDGERQEVAAFPGGQDLGIVGWMRTSQRSLLVRDFSQEMDGLPARPSYISTSPPRSAVFVPLVAGDQVVGSMSIQHPEPDAFDEDDLRILTILANQVASALANARLFLTARRRADQLATIAEVGRALTVVLDLDTLLGKVVELIQERFGYYHVQLFLVEHDTHRAVFKASSGHQLNKLWREQGRSQSFCEGMIGWVAGTGQSLLANDVSAEPRYIADDPRLLPDTRSELAVPIKIDGEVLGVLDVQARRLHAFGDDDLFVLEALANQVAVAIDGARSYQAQREEAWITTVLLAVAEAASRTTELDEVLSTITRLVTMLIGVTGCGIWLWNEELRLFEPAAAFGTRIPWDEVRRTSRLVAGMDGSAALARMQAQPRTMEIPYGDDQLPASLWRVWSGDRLLLVPVLSQNRQVGCLMASLPDDDLPWQAQQQRLTLLNGIANQAAAAIENVRLATAYQEEAWTSWALLEVSRAIGLSHSVAEVLEHVVRLVPLLAGVDRCVALLSEGADGAFVVVKEYLGRGATLRRFEGQRIEAGTVPLLDLAVATRQVQRVDDVAQSDLVPEQWQTYVGSKTLVALPLVVQDEVSGLLLIDDQDTPHMVGQRREQILTGIAQQVALALENYRLQAQEQERVRIGQELQVARHIQSSFLPSQAPRVAGYQLAHFWRSAREVGGDFFDWISLDPNHLGLLVADVAGKGVPAALFMATSLTLLRVAAPDHVRPRDVLLHANRPIGANGSPGMFVTVWYGVLDLTAHVLTYANAGHSLALHVAAADGTIRRLHTPGTPLGIMDSPGLGEEACSLNPGDLVVLYTDGVVEHLNERTEEFGQERLEQVLSAGREQSAEEIVAGVVAALRAHGHGTTGFDDMTVLVIKRLPQ